MGKGNLNTDSDDAISTEEDIIKQNQNNSLKENSVSVANRIDIENNESINGKNLKNDCVSKDKSNNLNEELKEEKPFVFRLRLIPIEKLLANPPKVNNEIINKKSNSKHSSQPKKILPERKNRAKVSIIELSDTESSDNSCNIIQITEKDNTSVETKKAINASNKNLSKDTIVIEHSITEKDNEITTNNHQNEIISNNDTRCSNNNTDKKNPKENLRTDSENSEIIKKSHKQNYKKHLTNDINNCKLSKKNKEQPKNHLSNENSADNNSILSNKNVNNNNNNNNKNKNKNKNRKLINSTDVSESESVFEFLKNQNKNQRTKSSVSVSKDNEEEGSSINSIKNKRKFVLDDDTESDSKSSKSDELIVSKFKTNKEDNSNKISTDSSTNSRDLKKSTKGDSSEESETEIIIRNKIRKRKSNKHLKTKRCEVRVKRIHFTDRFISLTKALTLIEKNQKKILNGTKMSQGGATAKLFTVETPSISNSLKTSIANSSDEDTDYDQIPDIQMEKEMDDTNSTQSDGKSSDDEIVPSRKKRVYNKENSEESDFEPQEKQKRRRRIKKNSSDSDDGDDKEKNKNKRKHIRKIIKAKDLDISTKTATREEEDRRKRIEERQRIYNKIYEKPDSIEVTELVLDFDQDTKDPLLEVDKGLLKKLKPHQVAGVKFMWDACYETLKDSEEKPGSGCILAHCMGLGKTLQIVTLVHTLLTNARKSNVERVLIISPLSTLNNWAREFKYWMSFARKKYIEVHDISRYKDKQTRIFKLNEWYEEGGVCILGYDMYRILANEKAKGLRKKQREQLQRALIDPGPDLVVCDEGHLLKNEKTSISKAVTKMRTKRRIVLTGTPLQNNLKEYYCMIQFIKPNLLGTYKEYMNRFVHPITNGQYTDSTERDLRLMKHRSHILHKMLEGCIQRRDYSVLAPYLPPKHEYVVYTTLSELQKQLYEYYMNTQRDLISSDIGGKGARLFQDFQDLRRIWTHPMNLRVNSDTVIRKRLMANDDESLDDFICDDDEEEEALNGSASDTTIDSSKSFASGDGGSSNKGGLKKRKTRSTKNRDGDNDSDCEILTPIVEKDDPSEWWKRFVEEKELNNLYHSPKLVILMSLLQQCEAIGDKLLVFSQSLQSLDVIEHFLSLIDSKTKGHEYEGNVGDYKGFWTPSIDYFRLDGSCSVEQREAMCKKFNDTTNLRARLFLISTRAGGLGINLVAANRVVIFDVSWNPSHDTQSIFRVYRFGQDKPCYIYRLIAIGTMEQKVYERQVTKQATAKRVIDEQQISRHYNQSDLQELYTYELQPSAEREIPILPKDRLFAELLSDYDSLLYKYHEHDSLLENEESENLSDSERKAAWAEYEAEKTRTTQTAQYISYDRNAFGAQFVANAAAGNVTSNKIFGFRSDVLLQLLNMKIQKDLPDLNQNQVIQLVPRYLQRLYAEMNNGDPSMYKDLLSLHATLAHPSGMYMNPLLYANQNPLAAGYFQSGGQQPQQPGATQQPQQQQPPRSAPGFDPNKVYEID